jgi:hypothetical protein
MKKIITILLIICIISFSVSCSTSDTSQSNDLANQYYKFAQECIDSCDVKKAIEALNEGINKTGDQNLKDLLSSIEKTAADKNSSLNASTSIDSAHTNSTVVSTENDTSSESAVKELSLKDLSKQDIVDLNRYLSCFSEQRFSQYPCGNEDLFYFAFGYNNTNTNNVFIDEGAVFDYSYCIDKSIIDRTIDNYFNVETGNISTKEIKLKDGIYYIPAGDGEYIGTYLSIARELCKESNNTYRIVFDIYEFLDSENYYTIPSHYYSLDTAAANSNPEFVKEGSGYVIIAQSGSDDYYVKEYKAN